MLKLLKLPILLILLTALLIPSGYSYAQEQEIKLIVNGNNLSLDVKPIIVSGRTLVPFRAILEALGATVSWNADTKTVAGIRNGNKIELTIDKKDALVNGKTKELDVPATIINSRTMVPVRFISEGLGAKLIGIAKPLQLL